jgi:hypothetical protein
MDFFCFLVVFAKLAVVAKMAPHAHRMVSDSIRVRASVRIGQISSGRENE